MGIYVNPVFAWPRPWIPASAGTTVWCGLRIRSGKTVREWVPASAGTTVWRGFRIKSGDGGMGTDVLSPLRGCESNPETVRKIGKGCQVSGVSWQSDPRVRV